MGYGRLGLDRRGLFSRNDPLKMEMAAQSVPSPCCAYTIALGQSQNFDWYRV